jgi:hypothetical protein
MIYANAAGRKRLALLLILGLGGCVSLLVGLSWDEVLHAHATDLARTENTFNLINPDHVFLVHAIVAGIVRLGHFLLVFGVVATLAGLIGAIYTRLLGSPPIAGGGWPPACAGSC